MIPVHSLMLNSSDVNCTIHEEVDSPGLHCFIKRTLLDLTPRSIDQLTKKIWFVINTDNYFLTGFYLN
jgi:hypothetical protein